MKIALISDELTYASLQKEARVKAVTPLNYQVILKKWKPDILFVESAWHGYHNQWKFKIASYKFRPWRNNNSLKKVVSYARSLNIPTLFWNKEDGVHFDRFIESAKLFDHIFTVDENCIPKYRAIVNNNVTINTLMFAIQPSIHNFTGFNWKYNEANFVGSYSHHIHSQRRIWQDIIFEATSKTKTPLTIFDRNSNRKSSKYRYPEYNHMTINAAVPYIETTQIYKDYLISFNVNTIEDSKTMFSRRLIEIIACGGIAITNNTPAVELHFKEYCYTFKNKKELIALLKRLKKGPTDTDLARAKAGAEFIAKNHTWTHRLQEIREIIGIK